MTAIDPKREPSTLITRSEDPTAEETALASLDARITPTDRFYIRSHFADVPVLDPASTSLVVDGEVENTVSLGYREILDMPATESTVTLECAGNSRSYVTPPAEGIQFDHGAVGTAVWKGVPLADILTIAGVKPSAAEVLFAGADSGEEEEEGRTLRVDYQRSLPLQEALDPNVLVAYEMNGEPLDRAHGSPFRVIVPGWYGMASVKWLTRITAVAKPFEGFFQTRRYVHITEGETGRAPWTPVTRIQVKSLIISPRHGEIIGPSGYTIRGVAWSGGGIITGVEVSTDRGRTWNEAELIGGAVPTAWRQWELSCDGYGPGHFVLMARAWDSAGNTQPSSIDWNFRGYANNAVHSIAVEVPPPRD